jgi:short-subunit dehydrogenase
MIVVASQAAVVPLSGLTTYSATKTFVSFVAEALNTEF